MKTRKQATCTMSTKGTKKKRRKNAQKLNNSKGRTEIDSKLNRSVSKEVNDNKEIKSSIIQESSVEESRAPASMQLEQLPFRTAVLGKNSLNKPHLDRSKTTFDVDQRVFGKFSNGDEWFPGKIEKVHKGNLYTILYDDGGRDRKIGVGSIRSTMESDTEIDTLDNQEDLTANMQNDENCSEHVFAVSSQSDDEWQIVNTAKSKSSISGPRFDADTGKPILSKKQRESRRRKERIREKNIALREESQSQGLHTRWGGSYNPRRKL